MLRTNSSVIYEELTYLEKELYINFSLFQNDKAAGLSIGKSISQFLHNFYKRRKLSPRTGSRRREWKL